MCLDDHLLRHPIKTTSKRFYRITAEYSQVLTEKSKLEQALVEKCDREARLTSTLAEKCEQHIEEMRRVASKHEQNIKEVTEQYSAKVSELESGNQTQASEILQLNSLLNRAEESKQKLEEECSILTTKYTEEKRQILADHEYHIAQMSTQFKMEISDLNASLMKKNEEIETIYRKVRIEAEELKESHRLATEHALQEQQRAHQDILNLVIILHCSHWHRCVVKRVTSVSK